MDRLSVKTVWSSVKGISRGIGVRPPVRIICTVSPPWSRPHVSSQFRSQGCLPDLQFLAIEVPQLAPGNDLLEPGGGGDTVGAQKLVDRRLLVRCRLLDNRVVAEGGNLTADVDHAFVHGVSEGIAGVTADDDAAL